MRTRHLKTQVDVLGHGGYREDTGGILGYGDGILRMRYFIPGHTGVSWGYPASQDTEGILGIPDRIPRIPPISQDAHLRFQMRLVSIKA